jgi:hypothetical protein
MDLGYTVFVAIFFEETNGNSHSKDFDINDFPLGENSWISLLLYSLDFVLVCIILGLLYMYAKKASQDEEKLKKYFLISIG